MTIWTDAKQLAEEVGAELKESSFWGLCFFIAVVVIGGTLCSRG